MQKPLLLFLILPIIAFSQSAVIKTICTFNHHKIEYYNEYVGKDVTGFCYYQFYSDSINPIKKINDTIKQYVFDSKKYNYSQPIEKLVYKKFRKEGDMDMEMEPLFNRNRLLSLKIIIGNYTSDWIEYFTKTPFYIHYDLRTGNFFTLQDMLNTKNDIFSFQQAVYGTMADSIRYFEQTTLNQMLDNGNIDKEKYSRIVERLNLNLSVFRANYLSDFVFTDKGIEEEFNCIMPDNIMPYNHTYRITFNYKELKNMVKQEYLNRLMK